MSTGPASFSSQLTNRWNVWNRPPEDPEAESTPSDAEGRILHATVLYRGGSFVLAGVALIETAVLIPFTFLARLFSGIYAAPYQALSQRLHSSYFTIYRNGSQITKSTSHYFSEEDLCSLHS